MKNEKKNARTKKTSATDIVHDTVPLHEKFPWHTALEQKLVQALQKNHLPHALLLSGIAGLGKQHFAHTFARLVLCQQAQKTEVCCEVCHACHLTKAGSHPDLMSVVPEQPGQAIKIDQIREVTHFVQETALQNGYRVIIIHPAHTMNMYAANALLKTLEEPTPQTLMILVCDQTDRLPATILSRCQKIIFSKPDTASALMWLKEKIADDQVQYERLLTIADGAPLKALQLVQQDIFKHREKLFQSLYSLAKKTIDPVTVAHEWHDEDAFLLLHLLQSWLRDIFRLMTVQHTVALVNEDYRSQLTELCRKISLLGLQKYLNQVRDTYAHLVQGLNLNKSLWMEALLIGWIYDVFG